MRKVLTDITDFMNTAPMTVLSILFSIRDLILSLAFILATPDITQTLLYQNIADIMPPALFGVLFGIICLVTIVAAITGSTKIVMRGLDAQAFLWLFSGFVYVFTGAWFLAMIFGLFFSAPSGYISYYYKVMSLWGKKRHQIREQDEAEQG